MSKKSFGNLRLRELDGGLNLKDYISEIENKQAVECKNWGFDGNKLISSKGIDLKYSNGGVGQAINYDGTDLITINSGSLYKNGVIQYKQNEYTFNIGNPDGEIFSLSIDGMTRTFKIGFFGNTQLAYETLEAELITWLGNDYYIEYISAGNYTIYKTDFTSIAFDSIDVVRNIQLSSWNVNAKITITIDGVSTTIDGATYPNVNDGLDYIVSQLPSSTYYTSVSGSLTIGRIDGSIPVITSTQFDRYTYDLGYLNGDTASSGEFLDYVDTTIDGTTFRYDKPGESRSYPGDDIITSLSGVRETGSVFFGSPTNYTGWKGVRFLNKTAGAKVVGAGYDDLDVTDVRLTALDGTVLETKTSDFATGFDYIMSANTEYRIECRSTIDTLRLRPCNYSGDSKWNNEIFETRGFSSDGTGGSASADANSIGISFLQIDGTLFDPSIYNTSFSISAFGSYSYMYINRVDYGTISISSLNTYTSPGSFPSNSAYTIINETNHLASISVATNTAIAITATNTGIQLRSEGLYNIVTTSNGILIHSLSTNQGNELQNPKNIYIKTNGEIINITSALSASGINNLPRIGTIYNGKMLFGGIYVNGVINDTIVHSKASSPSNEDDIFDFGAGGATAYNAGQQSISNGNKGKITGFSIGENGLYVFKENEVWYTNTEKDTGTTFDFIFNKVASYGALNQNCITEVGQETFYYDHITRRVRRLSYEQNLTTLRDRSISDGISPILESIPKEEGNTKWEGLINASFSHPLYKLHIADANANDVYVDVDGTDNDWVFKEPNRTLVYNVENKSWSEETNKNYDNVRPLASSNGYFITSNGDVYEDDIGNTTEAGVFKGKLHTNGDDNDVRVYGEVEISAKVIGGAGGKTLSITPIIHEHDDTTTDGTDYEETLSSTITSETQDVRERMSMYAYGRGIQHKVEHSGEGYCEVSSINTKVKNKSLKT